MPKLSAKIDMSQVSAKMKKIEESLGDFRSPLKDMGDDLIKFYGEENFDSQGSKVGEKWKPLAARTLQARARGYGHYAQSAIARNKILVWTGKLKAGFVKKVRRTSLEITNKVEYFKYNAKTRKMLDVNKSVIRIIEDVTAKYLTKIIK